MTTTNLMDDEIIVELRAQKEAFAASAGFDIRRLAAQIRLEETSSVQHGWAVVQPRLSTYQSAALDYAGIRFAP